MWQMFLIMEALSTISTNIYELIVKALICRLIIWILPYYITLIVTRLLFVPRHMPATSTVALMFTVTHTACHGHQSSFYLRSKEM